MTSRLGSVFLILGCLVLGGVGYTGCAVANLLYQDHQLLNQIRANEDLIRRQQAEQIRQFQQSQQTKPAQ